MGSLPERAYHFEFNLVTLFLSGFECRTCELPIRSLPSGRHSIHSFQRSHLHSGRRYLATVCSAALGASASISCSISASDKRREEGCDWVMRPTIAAQTKTAAGVGNGREKQGKRKEEWQAVSGVSSGNCGRRDGGNGGTKSSIVEIGCLQMDISVRDANSCSGSCLWPVFGAFVCCFSPEFTPFLLPLAQI